MQRTGFVAKSLLTASALVIAYALLVPRMVPKWNSWQSQGQTNIIKAQRYLYDAVPYEAVIVGSSLSTRLHEDSLPATICNLGFGGQGVQDGLKVLLRREDVPPVVLIETNYIFRPENTNFQTSVLSPAFYNLRKWVPVMRDEYQPIGLLKGWASARQEAARGSAPLERAQRDAVFLTMLDVQRKEYLEIPDVAAIDTIMAHLKTLTDAVEQRGSRIVLFEMPIDSALAELPYSEAVRAVFAQHYPAGQYTMIAPPDPATFQTTDGLHLDGESAARYTGQLVRALGK